MKKLILLLFVVVLAVSSAMVIGCGNGGNGGGDSDEAQVKAVAEKYADAATSFDIEAMLEVLSEKDREGFTDEQIEESKKQSEEMGDLDFDIKIEVGEVKVMGDEATVKMISEFGGEESTMTIYLVKENGEWKVDLMKSSSESMGDTLDETTDEPVEDTTE